MNILFLGPQCSSLETYFIEKGHSFVRTEEALSLAWIQEQRFDFGVSYRYKRIIKKDVINYFAGRLINMHISFLPWNRGYAPNFWSHMENTPKGVSIHRVNEGIDTGDLLLQHEVSIDQETDTLRTSYDKLSHAIEKLFIDNADALLANAIPVAPQMGAGSFHCANDQLPYVQNIGGLDYDEIINILVKKMRGGGGKTLS
jgi:methionyl-tRNA formyltransferase